ncbi:MAG: hypothetical protein AAF366_12605 [Pseudomonadota bacterium]
METAKSTITIKAPDSAGAVEIYTTKDDPIPIVALPWRTSQCV